MNRVISKNLTVLVHGARNKRCDTRNGVTISRRGRVNCAPEHSLSDSCDEFLVPERGSYLRVVRCGGAGLTTLALLKPFGVLALPDIFGAPEVLDDSLGAVHKLLPVGDFDVDGRSVPRDVRAVLSILVNNETEVGLVVLLWHLEDSLVEVQSIDVHRAGYLQEELEVVDEIPTEVPEWGSL